MRAKTTEQARARELRLEGRTYDEIAAQLGVSRKSVARWTQGVPCPPRQGPRYARRPLSSVLGGDIAARDTLRARAVGLRLQGMSTAQIADELGIRRSSTLSGWLVGTPAPAWTARPRAKDAARGKARGLRHQGLTYGEIAARLGVSKSSISLWTRDMPHPTTPERDCDARQAGAKRYFDERRRRVFVESQNDKLGWANRLGLLSDREILIAGAVAYWAEGTKWKPWRRTERVTFVNSDAAMIRLFLAYLMLMDVAQERIRYRVQIHESADVVAAERFWADVVGVPADRLMKTTLKRHTPRTNRKNIGVDYHGCLCVVVMQSAALYRQIEGTWWAVRQGPGAKMPEAAPTPVTRGPLDPVSGLPLRLARFRRILRQRYPRRDVP